MPNVDRNPIAKALRALSWVVESANADVGVRELAGALKISPSSAHRLLLALADDGFVTQDRNTSRYRVGIEFLRLCHLTVARAPIRQAALPPMRQLVNACNETALLGIYNSARQEMMFAASVESSHPLRYVVDLNKWLPVYSGATGLAIMAFLSEEEIDSIIERTQLSPLTGRTITEPHRLKAEINNIRQQGYAFTRGQRIPDAVGIAAPVFGGAGELLGDVCLTIPKQRFEERSKRHLIELLLACAKRISAEMTGSPRNQAAA